MYITKFSKQELMEIRVMVIENHMLGKIEEVRCDLNYIEHEDFKALQTIVTFVSEDKKLEITIPFSYFYDYSPLTKQLKEYFIHGKSD